MNESGSSEDNPAVNSQETSGNEGPKIRVLI